MSTTSLRLRVVPRYPAMVTATDGIKAVRSGVDLAIKSDYSNLVQVPDVTNPDKTFVLVWDADIDNYQSMSFTNIINNVQDAVIGPPLAAIDAANPGTDQVVYFTTEGEASTFTASAFVRGISNSVDGPAFASVIGALQPGISSVTRAGNYLGVGQQANFDGNGKGGIQIGGGDASRGTGSWISSDGHGNWNSIQSAKNNNPTELIIYNSAARGRASAVVSTGNISRIDGSAFDASWVGTNLYFLRKKFRVSAFIDANTITLTESDGSAVTFSSADTEFFQWCYTTGSGICNVSGTTVTWVSGDPFVPLFFSDFEFKINGVVCTVSSFVDIKTLTLASAPGDASNVSFSYRGNINDQLSTLRVQSVAGSDEENVNLYAIAGDNNLGRYYALRSGLAGNGKNRPIFIGSGNYAGYFARDQIGVYPEDATAGHNGYASLGGVQGYESLRVYLSATPVRGQFLRIDPKTSGNSIGLQADGVSDANIDAFITGKGTGSVLLGNHLANYVKISGANSGFDPAVRAQGSDANRGLGLDMKGSGGLNISQDFARTLMKVQGNGSTVNFLNIVASVTNSPVTLAAAGNDTNIDLSLSGKGTGALVAGSILCNKVSTGLTATGTTQGTALALTSTVNEVTTTASGAGVILPNKIGALITVINSGANALLVYPPSGAAINALSINAGFSLAAGGKQTFIITSTTKVYA